MFILEKVIGVLAPHACVVCDQEGTVVCAWCLPDLAQPLPSRCFRCLAATPNSQVCRRCRTHTKLKHVWVRTPYMGHIKQLVYDFKFERKQAAAAPIAQLLVESLPYMPPATIVTHVPTATSRVRQRGYDHAALVAQTVARRLGLPYASLLSRRGQARQVGATRQQRLTQLKDAFTVNRPEQVRRASILLIDDIVTTGATLGSAAEALRHAGAARVDAAVLAQKQ